MFSDWKRLVKYLGILFAVIFGTGASTFVVIPYAYNNIRPSYPELYGVIYYYPLYALAAVAIGAYFRSRRTVNMPVPQGGAPETPSEQPPSTPTPTKDKFGLD